MATENQIAANRENAKLSHGPVTQEGKAAVRLNALKHGLRARQLVLPDESQEDFDQLAHDLESEWQPATPTERICLENMLAAQWRLIRAEINYAFLQSLAADDPRTKQLTTVLLFQDRFQRAFHRALRDLQTLQKDRRRATEQAAAEEARALARQPSEPARFRDTKDENGNPMRVVDVPEKVWNVAFNCYDLVYSSKLNYPEKLRPLFSKFVKEYEEPAPEVPGQAA
ncbi:MAG TPA: hypothetical protein VKV17_03445 [Bryobacteraceae bacterium]|nr:hypothetical protein [Bryobacteraceae bacterium]